MRKWISSYGTPVILAIGLIGGLVIWTIDVRLESRIGSLQERVNALEDRMFDLDDDIRDLNWRQPAS